MKIATAIGAEESRNMPVPGHQSANTQSISFAESLGESMAVETPATASSKSGTQEKTSLRGPASMPFQRGNSLSPSQKDEDMASPKEVDVVARKEKSMNQLGRPLVGTLSETAVGTPSKLAAGTLMETNNVASVETQDAEKVAFPERMAKIAAEVKSMSHKSTAPSVIESAVPEAGQIADAKTSALIVLPGSDVSKAATHLSSKESGAKNGGKIEGDKTASHKPVKKDALAGGPGVGSVVADQQPQPEFTAPQTAALIMTASVAPAVSALVAPANDKDAPAVTVPVTGSKSRAKVREPQTGKAPDTPETSKTEGLSATAASTDSEKDSDAKLRQLDSSAASQSATTGDITLHAAAKEHAPVEVPRGMVLPAAEPQFQTQAVTNAAADKSQLSSAHLMKTQDDGATPHLYAADEQKTIVATPTSLEVGVPGGTHGWLKVRAELAGDGAVHASVSSSSSAGTEMLRRELPSIATYLHLEQVSVSSVMVHAQSGTTNFSDLSNGGGNQQREAGQSAADARSGSGQENAAAGNDGKESSRRGVTEESGGEDWPSNGYAGPGGWLSVRA